MEFHIHEINPNGEDSIKSILNWIENKKQKATNPKGLWNELIPEIKQSIKYELSSSNPNDWPTLSPEYLQEKREKGWPDTIGVATGSMKKALTDEAKVKVAKDYLLWAINEDIRGNEGERVGDYAQDFDTFRPLFKQTIRFVNKIIQKAISKWMLGK